MPIAWDEHIHNTSPFFLIEFQIINLLDSHCVLIVCFSLVLCNPWMKFLHFEYLKISVFFLPLFPILPSFSVISDYMHKSTTQWQLTHCNSSIPIHRKSFIFIFCCCCYSEILFLFLVHLRCICNRILLFSQLKTTNL